jgi:hypothetical protein
MPVNAVFFIDRVTIGCNFLSRRIASCGILKFRASFQTLLDLYWIHSPLRLELGLDVANMRFFTRKRNKASLSTASTASTSKLNSRSGESQVGTGVAQPIASSSPEVLSLPTVKKTQALWEKAYDDLKTKENKLVDDYERILSRELKGGLSDAGMYWPIAGPPDWIMIR